MAMIMKSKQHQDTNKNTVHRAVVQKLRTKDGKTIYLKNSKGKYNRQQILEMKKDKTKEVLSKIIQPITEKVSAFLLNEFLNLFQPTQICQQKTNGSKKK